MPDDTFSISEKGKMVLNCYSFCNRKFSIAALGFNKVSILSFSSWNLDRPSYFIKSTLLSVLNLECLIPGLLV